MAATQQVSRLPHRKGAATMTATLRLRTAQLDKLRHTAGLATDAALAARMGMDPSSLSRVLAGKQAPGGRFIASLVACFPGWAIDDLFEIVHDEDDDGAAA